MRTVGPGGGGAYSCQDKAGFLFKHPCTRRGVQVCAECSISVCDKHYKAVEGRGLCTACTKKSKRARGASYHDDDPYFYSDRHYRGYGRYGSGYWGHSHYRDHHRHDADDFTEADGESFQGEGHEGFEQDMGAS